MQTKILKNACICCGGDIVVKYDSEEALCFAEATDVCPTCWQADCSGISVAANERHCNVLGGPSKPLTSQ